MGPYQKVEPEPSKKGEPEPSLGPAQARPGLALFWMDRSRLGLDFLRRAQKIEAFWLMYVVKIRGSSRLRLDFFRRA